MATATTDPSKRVDINYRTGTDFVLPISVLNQADSSNFDFTGYDVNLYVKRFQGDTIYMTASVGDGVTLSSGQILLDIADDDAELSALLVDFYFYELIVTDTDGKKKAWMNGKFQVHDNLEDESTSSVTITIATSNDAITINVVEINTSTVLNDISDVTLTSPANGQTLEYDSTTSNWINSNKGIWTQSTGVISGMVLSINADTTKFDISAGTGIIVDSYTDPTNPALYNVTLSAQTAVTVTNLATSSLSHILIDKDGAIVQQTTYPTNEDFREYIYLGQLGHSDNTNVANVLNSQDVLFNPLSQLRDFELAAGVINLGRRVSANGANLNLDVSAGSVFALGINPTNAKDPNTRSFAAGTAIAFRTRTQDGSGSAGTVTVLDPNNYDVGGTVTAMPNNRWQNQRVYQLTNGNIVIMYGQTTYTKKVDAIAAARNEAHVKLANISDNAVLINIITVQDGATDLSDTDQAVFLLVNKFGEDIGGAAGISLSTLQNAYKNSSEPEITTDSTRGAVTVRGGTGTDTDNNLEIQDNSGATTFAIQADGLFSDYKTLVDVRNTTGVTITKGSLVYINGASGNRPTIALADASTQATSEALIGFVYEDISNNGNGRVMKAGTLMNIDTSAFTEGDQLYLSATTPGAFTNTKPAARSIKVGFVSVSSVGAGEIVVLIDRVGLQVSYEATDDGKITTDSNVGSLKIQGGTGTNTDLNLESKNNAGTTTFSVDGNGLITGGQLTIAENTDATTILGRARIDSRNTDNAYFSHYDFSSTTNFALRQLSSGSVTLNAQTGSQVQISNNATSKMTVSALGVELADGVPLRTNTTTGSNVASAPTQKLAFWGATPIVQPSTTGTTAGFTAGAGTGVNDDSTFTGNTGASAYTIGDIVKAMKDTGLLAT